MGHRQGGAVGGGVTWQHPPRSQGEGGVQYRSVGLDPEAEVLVLPFWFRGYANEVQDMSCSHSRSSGLLPTGYYNRVKGNYDSGGPGPMTRYLVWFSARMRNWAFKFTCRTHNV